MDEDDYFNGEDYVTLDGGINDNNDYPSSNDNGGDGNHHEEYVENYRNVDNTLVGNIVDQTIINQQNELVRQQEDQKFKEIKETSEKIKVKNAPQAYELTPQYQEYQRKIAEAWADMHKRIALEKEVIHPKEDKIEFDKQKIRIDSTKKELDALNSNQPKKQFF